MLKEKSKILVTGATGFVGSHMAHRLVKDGHEVHVIIREKSNTYRIDDIISNVSVHKGNLEDKTFLQSIVKNFRFDGIFHFAASLIIPGVTDDDFINTNALGTLNLINTLAETDYSFFINSGSFLEYGSKTVAIKESDICLPNELYGITKLTGTLYARVISKTKNKPIITFRIFTPYGPFNGRDRLVHRIIANSLDNKDIELTSPNVSRDFIFTDDIIDLYLEAAEKASQFSGEIFNAGTGVKTTIGELVDYVVKKIGSKSNIKWGAFQSAKYDSDIWQADMTKTFSTFKWRPKYDLKSGVDKTIEEFKKEHLK